MPEKKPAPEGSKKKREKSHSPGWTFITGGLHRRRKSKMRMRQMGGSWSTFGERWGGWSPPHVWPWGRKRAEKSLDFGWGENLKEIEKRQCPPSSLMDTAKMLETPPSENRTCLETTQIQGYLSADKKSTDWNAPEENRICLGGKICIPFSGCDARVRTHSGLAMKPLVWQNENLLVG